MTAVGAGAEVTMIARDYATDATVGIIANPMSGRDIRRLVARASVFPNAEKTSMILRLTAAAGSLGVQRVLVSTDAFGIAAGVLRATRRRAGKPDPTWPRVEFCELAPPTSTAADTRTLVREMRARGAGLIVLLGGDGTVRAAAAELGDIPVLPLSTGTNNAFPQLWEATVAGAAAALVATGQIDAREATRRAKVLRVTCGRREELALVDVCVSTVDYVGARALWQTAALRELYCAFAEPHAIGLSSIAAQLRPTARDSPWGVTLRLAGEGPAPLSVLAPIAPGILANVGVLDVADLALHRPTWIQVPAGTVAVDGEREIEFGRHEHVSVTLSDRGPLVVDVPTVLRAAAERQLLVTQPTKSGTLRRVAMR
jgi:predicted polyphosphate/ATP-dependent NAD kinase